jgi:hypothetical protein
MGPSTSPAHASLFWQAIGVSYSAARACASMPTTRSSDGSLQWMQRTATVERSYRYYVPAHVRAGNPAHPRIPAPPHHTRLAFSERSHVDMAPSSADLPHVPGHWLLRVADIAFLPVLAPVLAGLAISLAVIRRGAWRCRDVSRSSGTTCRFFATCGAALGESVLLLCAVTLPLCVLCERREVCSDRTHVPSTR